jgi:hypothetical protein
VLVGLAAAAGGSLWWSSAWWGPIAGITAVTGAVVARLGRRPPEAYDTLETLRLGIAGRVAVLGRELVGDIWAPALAGLLAVGGGLLGGAGSGLAGVGLMVAAAALAWGGGHRLPAVSAEVADASAGVVADATTDRAVWRGLARREDVVAVPQRPYLFRGLAGWNLGLGLGDEQAAWAGQLARHLGLGAVLGQAEGRIGRVEAWKIALCRALATPGGIIALDEPDLEPRDRRLVTRLLGEDGRPVVVTSRTPERIRGIVI